MKFLDKGNPDCINSFLKRSSGFLILLDLLEAAAHSEKSAGKQPFISKRELMTIFDCLLIRIYRTLNILLEENNVSESDVGINQQVRESFPSQSLLFSSQGLSVDEIFRKLNGSKDIFSGIFHQTL